MTKGEVLQQLGLVMLRPDLDEEADEDFIECMKAIKDCHKALFKDNKANVVSDGGHTHVGR